MPAPRSSSARQQASRTSRSRSPRKEAVSSLVEQLVNRVLRPLDVVLLSRELIQQTMDEAAERGRMTRADANELVGQLVARGRRQTDTLLRDLERVVERGRDQVESAARVSVEHFARSADRARRSVGGASSPPIAGYDELTAAQAQKRLGQLTPAELRQLRDYERRHMNRKTVLGAIEHALG